MAETNSILTKDLQSVWIEEEGERVEQSRVE